MPPCYVITSMVSKSLLPNVRVPSSPTSISWAKKCWQHVSETTFSLLIRLYKGHQEQVMSNSTFLRPFGSKRTSSSGHLVSFTQIKSWSRVASFYCILMYRFSVEWQGSSLSTGTKYLAHTYYFHYAKLFISSNIF